MKVNGGGDSPLFFSEDVHHRECGDGEDEDRYKRHLVDEPVLGGDLFVHVR